MHLGLPGEVFNLFFSQKFIEYLSGGPIAENASGTFIKAIGDGVEFVLRGSGQVGAFG
jgi:hypothetical protein